MQANQDIAPLHEAVIGYLCRVFIEDDAVLRKLRNYEDELLTLEEVAGLLKCSDQKLKNMIKDREWVMVIGPGGGYVMTRGQYREQRDKYIAIKKRGF